MEAATPEPDRAGINKFSLLTNFLSHRTYALVADAPDYASAETALHNTYHKRKNLVFLRHLLMSRTQNSGDSIAE